MDEIRDRFGVAYRIIRSPLQADGTVIYHVFNNGTELVARAVLRFFKCCIDDVLVYKESDRRKGIASALYRLIEEELDRPLRPSRIRSKAGRAFLAGRR